MGTISSFSKVRSLKSCPLRAHCKLPIVHLSIGFLHNPLPPLRRSQQPIGALTVVPVCVDALASAQICAVSKAGAGCLVMEYCLQSRVRCNAELVEPIWGLKKTNGKLHVAEFKITRPSFPGLLLPVTVTASVPSANKSTENVIARSRKSVQCCSCYDCWRPLC